MAWLEEQLQQAKQMGASDIHFMQKMPVRYRINGVLRAVSEEILPENCIRTWLETVLTAKQLETYRERGEITFTDTQEGLFRIRVQAFRQNTGDAACVHLLPLCPPKINELLIPEPVCAMLKQKKGLFLIAGETGAGKSTTLAALTEALAQEKGKKITVLEKNTEYLYASVPALLIQREIDTHMKTMADGIRSALQQDTDVITVAEIEDAESFEAVLRAVELGHLVLAVVEAENSFLAIETLLFLAGEQDRSRMQQRLANVLSGGMSQQLLPKEDGSGMAAAYSYYTGTEDLRGLLREGKLTALSTMLLSGERAGGRSMEDAVYELYMQSMISSETAVYYAPDSAEMQRKVSLF